MWQWTDQTVVRRADRVKAAFTGALVAGVLTAGALVARADSSDAFEKDRKAILAMAGEYKVTFQFEESVALRPGYELHEPHVSDATEFIEVIADTGRFISLQHVLVMHSEEEGESPRVVKHWRQDWTYEDTQLLEYAGHRTWKQRTLSAEDVRGTWSQAVFQVDDSPRYESMGRWLHEGTASSWEGNETWRPLPRREHTTRDDYQVLVSRNRHTLTPAGWVHEQDNRKLVLDGELAGQSHCREVGLNLYERVTGVDFTAGREYWAKTSAYWADVRAAWDRTFAANPTLKLRGKVEDKPMHSYFFETASEVKAQPAYDADEGRQDIQRTLALFVE